MAKGSRMRNRRVVPSWELPKATLPNDGLFSFLTQSIRHDNFGEPGIAQFAASAFAGVPIEVMTYRCEVGLLRGILQFFPDDVLGWERAGAMYVFVDGLWQRKGIATQLFERADSQFGIDLTEQRYTAEGRAFALAMAEKRGYVDHRRFVVSQLGSTEIR